MSAQSAFASAVLDPGVPCPRELAAWNGSQVERRFGVYRNNVLATLTDSLADTFPVVQALVGTEFFRAMAGVFVRRRPPQSPVLLEYGHGFGDFIQGFEPASGLPYLADVARLEMARLAATHSADAVPLPVQVAQSALDRGEQAARARLEMHPSLRMVRSSYAIVSVWAAHQGYGDLADIDLSQPETALVVRPALDTLVLVCPQGSAEFIGNLQRGADMAESAGLAAAACSTFDLAASIAMLLGHGAITSITVPEGQP